MNFPISRYPHRTKLKLNSSSLKQVIRVINIIQKVRFTKAYYCNRMTLNGIVN
jgi:hypothetical protein